MELNMKRATMHLISADGERAIEFSCPALLSNLFAQNGIPVDMPCGGKKRCLKCKVQVSGCVSPIDEREKSFLTKAELKSNIRYACMTYAVGDIKVEIKKSAQGESNI